ncbi:MAG: hypothetical protein K8R21_11890 [Leptospira sp.]|nr:hypothetical protein [Leptospira sp.]
MQLILFIIMSVIVFSFPVFGNDNRDEFVRLDSKIQKVEIGKFVSFYEDPTGSLLIDDVSNPGFRNKFANSIKESLNFGFTESAIWLRFEVRNEDQSSNDWLLEIGFPVLDQIEIFAKQNEVWIKKEYGDSIPFASRDFYYRTFIYRLETSSDRTETIYLKVRSTSAMIIPLTIFKTAAFQRESYLMESYYFSIYGILGVMIIYNAFVFFAFRGWSYLLYTLNTLFSLLAFVSLNGHGFQYLWPEMLWWQNRFPFFSGCLVGISGIAFSSQFLGLRKSYPFAFRILGGFQFLLASLCIIGAFSIKNAIQNVNIVNSIAFIFVMIIAVRSFLDGNKSARFFILGWTVLILGGVLIIFRFLGLLPDNFFTRHTLEIGSMIELVLLSLALVDKYKIIQDENIRVHKELFETERQVKETLEIKVNERTAELNKSMQLIKEDLAIAKKIQINTMPTNLKKMQDLEIAVGFMII